jgi:hypothetical protein
MNFDWPDGVTYVNEIHRHDAQINCIAPVIDYFNFIFLPTNWATSVNIVNWSETSGGTGEKKVTYQSRTLYGSPYDLVDNWPAGRYPEFADGDEVSLPDGGTNGATVPNYPIWDTAAAYGAINFVSSDGTYTLENDDQAQATLITGGDAGSTDTELYQITGSAVEFSLTDQSFPSGTYVGIPPEQIQIGSLGSLVTSGMNGPYPSGTLYAVLPAHKQVPITPHAKGSKYNRAGVSVQPIPLVSQCVATTPSNRARTTLGVGEQVNLSFPSLSTPYSNVVWNTSAGSLSYTTGTSTQLTAPSNAANVIVTVKVFGKLITKKFSVVEPDGYYHAKTTGTIHYSSGTAGAGMTNIIWMTPTNVSFYRVKMIEIGRIATNTTGYFTNTNQWPPDYLDHGQHGANQWFSLGYDNSWRDRALSGTCPSPWTSGNFTWPIPAAWKVSDAGVTNSMKEWSQNFTIDSSGTVEVDKFKNWVRRTTSDIITTSP